MAHFGRAQIQQKLKQYKEAAESASKALDLEPSSGPAHAARGLAEYKLGNLQPALKDLQAATKLCPGPDVAVQLGLAKLYLQQKDQASCEDVLGKCESGRDPKVAVKIGINLLAYS